MTSKDIISSQSLETAAAQLIHLIRDSDTSTVASLITDSTLQQLTTLIIQICAQKIGDAEGKGEVPITERGTVTATDAAIFIDKLLRTVDLELFEIQMWRNLGSNR